MRKRKARKAIGVILLLLVFAFFIAVTSAVTGVKTALVMWGVTLLIVVMLATAVWLLSE